MQMGSKACQPDASACRRYQLQIVIHSGTYAPLLASFFLYVSRASWASCITFPPSSEVHAEGSVRVLGSGLPGRAMVETGTVRRSAV